MTPDMEYFILLGALWQVIFKLTSFCPTEGQVSPALGPIKIRMRINLWIVSWQRFSARLSNLAYNGFSRLNPWVSFLMAAIRLKSRIWPENYLLSFLVEIWPLFMGNTSQREPFLSAKVTIILPLAL
jgi:hypothetical protein